MSLDCNCRVEVPVKRGSRSLRGVACFAAAVILFLTLRSGVFGLFQPLSVAAAQLAVFPLVILCLGQVVFLSQKLPAQLMVVAVAAALVAAALRYNWKRAEVGTVYLARLQGDEFETSTRVLRESLNAELRSYGKVKIVGYPAEVSHASEV
ncbi:MAG: hypothetical protein GX589_02615, partial [Deltaproteobacteria bacterium]|nr:hypothetical protein [Deltaproteobacteria bacterium]